jgi:hypothetical protein
LELDKNDLIKFKIDTNIVWPYLVGDEVRDWISHPSIHIPFPYNSNFELINISNLPSLQKFLWPHRYWLRDRFVSGGTRMSDVGMPYHNTPASSHAARVP